jgi:hypothetical protein
LKRVRLSNPAIQVTAVLLLVVLLAALAMVRGLNHDESQYVAATQLALTGLPYRDFAYLQTPLQPMLFAPLAALFPNDLFVSLRLANAACGAAAVVLLWLTLRRAGVAERTAAITALLMAACEPLLFVSAVARNDALPLMLFCGSLALLAGDPKARNTFLAALLLGCAAAAKISFAIPAAALVAAALIGPRAVRERLDFLPLAAGFAIPTLFVAGLAALAPQAFWFEVIDYGFEAPREWYAINGRAGEFGAKHVAEFLRHGLSGPMLAGLIVIVAARWHGRNEPQPFATLMAILLAASLVAAFLPNPTHKQYWAPALPPLFVCLGLALNRPLRFRWLFALLLGGTAVAGLAKSGESVVEAIGNDEPALMLDDQADALRILLDRHRVDGKIAGIVPERFIDTGRPVDRRFATGPFLFRTLKLISPDEARKWGVMPLMEAEMLVEDPPAAIVTMAEPERYPGDEFLTKEMEQAASGAGFHPVGRTGPMILWLPNSRPKRP